MFIQDVKAAPYPMSVSCFEWKIQDMVQFLTCNHRFGVLTMDTTPITYLHLMIEDISKTKRHPIMLDPLLMHQKSIFLLLIISQAPSLSYKKNSSMF